MFISKQELKRSRFIDLQLQVKGVTRKYFISCLGITSISELDFIQELKAGKLSGGLQWKKHTNRSCPNIYDRITAQGRIILAFNHTRSHDVCLMYPHAQKVPQLHTCLQDAICMQTLGTV